MKSCLICQNALTLVTIVHGYSTHEFAAAEDCEFHFINQHHSVLDCSQCNSIHIYCNECSGYVQLVERDINMNYYVYGTPMYAWRDCNGKYDYTTLTMELTKKYKTDFPEDYDRKQIKQKLVDDKIVNTMEEADELYWGIADALFDHLNDTKTFKVIDLNMFCLNPNDERLIHPAESGIAMKGSGFNIRHGSNARWCCAHGASTIYGS